MTDPELEQFQDKAGWLVNHLLFMSERYLAIADKVGIIPLSTWVGLGFNPDDLVEKPLENQPLVWLRIGEHAETAFFANLRNVAFKDPRPIRATRTSGSSIIVYVGTAAAPRNNSSAGEERARFAFGLVAACAMGMISPYTARQRAGEGLGDGYDFSWLVEMLHEHA